MPLSKKLCPLLLSRGVFFNGKRLVNKKDHYWIKKFCLGGECPLDECVYDKAGKISVEDRKLLEEIKNEN